MNKILLIIFLFMLVLPALLIATGSFDAGWYKNKKGESLKYRIHLPDELSNTSKEQLYPLIIFFHGSGKRGWDNFLPVLGSAQEILGITKRLKDPVIMLVPQCPLGQQWVDTSRENITHRMDKEPATPMKLTMELLDDILKKYPVDSRRIYVVGYSMGGFAAWEILQRMPDMFAGALPICGGGDEGLAPLIKSVPVWVFHGENDTIVSPDRSRDMVKALKQAGGNPIYTEYKNTGHNSWARTFRNKDVISWLLDQSK